jgi:hypothetical protein
MDLLGRKVAIDQGAYFRAVMEEIGKTIDEAKGVESLKELAAAVEGAVQDCVSVTMALGQIGLSGKVEEYLSHATAYLRIFSQMAVSWLFLWESVAAHKALDAKPANATFYESKLATAAFYINTILPTSGALVKTILHGDRSALGFKPEWF